MSSAIEWITEQETSIPKPFISAIVVRLRFRATFLKAIDLDSDVIDQQKQNYLWDKCLENLLEFHNGREFSKAVDHAFSPKIQRRLASTVPPRPIVDISFDDAYKHLEQLCKDGKYVARVLGCKGGSNVLVANDYLFCFD